MDGSVSNIGTCVTLIRTSLQGQVSFPCNLTFSFEQDLYVTPRTTMILTKDFGSSPRVLVKYYIHSSDSVTPTSPKSWTFEASNDNSLWVVLDSRSNQADPGISSPMGPYSFNNGVSYRYYRLNVTAGNGAYLYISKMVLIESVQTIPVTLFTAVGGSGMTLDITDVTDIVSCIPVGGSPTGSVVYFAVSFDGGTIYNAYVGGWRQIAKNATGTWKYNSSATPTPTWVASSENNARRALHQAFGVASNQMDASILASLEASDWSDTGGFDYTTHTDLDFAFGLSATTAIPEVSGYTIYVTSGGGYTSFGLNTTKVNSPTQPLSSLHPNGVMDISPGVVFHRAATGDNIDGTVSVADNTDSTYLTLTSSGGGFNVSDSLYIGGVNPFGSVYLEFVSGATNIISSAAAVSLWDGRDWINVTVTDNTSISGKMFNANGYLSWEPVTWWTKSPSVVGGVTVVGYFARIRCNAQLTNNVKISYTRITEVPASLPKYTNAATFNNSIILANTTSAPDMVVVSAPYEEYNWSGTGATSSRVGGTDEIIALFNNYDTLLIAKRDEWWFLDKSLTLSRSEAGGHSPLNSRSIVRAPLDAKGKQILSSTAEAANKQGIYFINSTGAWVFTGSQIYGLSEFSSWWDRDTSVYPRLDLDYLPRSHGAYLPERNWVLWNVPMITSSNLTGVQGQCNYIIVYDISLGVWLTPFDMPISSMAVILNDYGTHSLIGGTPSGQIVRLFEDDGDMGNEVNAWAETGWLSFGPMYLEQQIHSLRVYGKTGTQGLTVRVYRDGVESVPNSNYILTVNDIPSIIGHSFDISHDKTNLRGRIFKFRFEFSGDSCINGIELAVPAVREWPIKKPS